MSKHASITGNWGIEKNTKEPEKRKATKISIPVGDVGFYLLTPLLLGVLLGGFLDKQFNTKPFLTIILIVFGAISSFYNLWRLTKPHGS